MNQSKLPRPNYGSWSCKWSGKRLGTGDVNGRVQVWYRSGKRLGTGEVNGRVQVG